jgi:hypothetical protein
MASSGFIWQLPLPANFLYSKLRKAVKTCCLAKKIHIWFSALGVDNEK